LRPQYTNNMNKRDTNLAVIKEIEDKISLIRGERVMLDSDLAEPETDEDLHAVREAVELCPVGAPKEDV
jgi:SpoU rRNA methylase family enzyme